jgi:putative DNA primase/helicase
MSTFSAVEDFKAAIRAAGLEPPEVIVPGQFHRFPGYGKRPSNRAAWAKLYADGRGGSFGDFAGGWARSWQANGAILTPEERAEHQRAIEQARSERSADAAHRQERAAERARAIWQAASPAPDDHPYLQRKNVGAHGLRVTDWVKRAKDPNRHGWRSLIISNALLVPLTDASGALWNLQAIFPERHPTLGRDKDFLPGGRKTGLFHRIGPAEVPTDGTVRIAEGFATAATIRETTGDTTFVAFDAGNLKAVAQAVRALYPDRRIVVMSDNDRWAPGNPGVAKAKEAARAVRGSIAVPQFPEGAAGTDWNDLAALLRGKEAA